MEDGFSNVGAGSATGVSNFFSSQNQTNSPAGLLNLAQQQGGAVAEQANELVHPTTNIFSTMSDAFKNSFKEFVNILSVPSEVVAGAMSPDYSIGQAISQHIMPSDVIFGAQNPNDTTMQKIGSFVTRTAADVLFDPLTYVTFGADSGFLFGARAATKITVGAEAAGEIGLAAGDSAVVSKEGTELYSYLKKVQAQGEGLTSALSAASSEAGTKTSLAARLSIFKDANLAKQVSSLSPEVFDMSKTELNDLLRESIDAPLDVDFAKKAMTNLMEKNPQLAQTLLDKGGIKIFGQSILSGQRIRSAIKLIPGATILDEATTPVRNSINALFDPRMVKLESGAWQRLPEEYTLFEQQARDLTDSLKDDRVGQLMNITRANNLNVNETKFLFASVEARKMPSDPRLANAFKQLLNYNDQEFAALRGAGIPVTYLDKHVPHMLVTNDTKVLPFTLPPSQKVGAAMQRTLEGTVFNTDSQKLEGLEGAVLGKDSKRVNDILTEMKNSGFHIFDDNIVTALAKRSMDNSKAISTRAFLDGLAKNFSATAGSAPDGWRALNLSGFKQEDEMLQKIGMATESLRFHPAIASRVEKFIGSVINDDATHDALKAYDSIQNLWKASVTSIFPAFHGRNAISNVFMHFNDLGYNSFNPAMHAMASQLVAADIKLGSLTRDAMKVGATEADKAALSDHLLSKVFTDSGGHEWSFGELRQVMKNNNIAFNHNIVGQIDVARDPQALVQAMFPQSEKDALAMGKNFAKKALPVGQDFLPFQVGREVGNAIESQARALDFVTNLKNTGDVSLATARTKQFLFDYQNLTPFEKTFMRRITPFYTYTRKNLELQAHTLLTAPGRIAGQVYALQNIGDAISGGKLTDEQEAALPDWIKSGIQILKKQNGNQVEIYGALGTPLEQPFTAFQSNQLLGSLSPILRLPLEYGTGYDFFQGKPISETTNAAAFKSAPEPVKQLIGYTEVKTKNSSGQTYTLAVSLRPEMMHLLLNLPPTTRVFSALQQVQNVNVDDGSKIMQQLIGVKPYSFDVQQEAQKRQNELKSKLQDILTNAGVTAQFTRTYVPKPI